MPDTDNRKHCAVVTGTRYIDPSDERAGLSLTMIRDVANDNRIVVVDDSAPWYHAQLKQLAGPNVTVLRQNVEGMAEGRKQGIRFAMSLPGVIAGAFIEPEKINMAKYLDVCFAPIFSGGAVFSLAARMPASLEMYPPTQRASERDGNKVCRAATGRGDVDFFFGPYFFNRDGYNYIMAKDHDFPGIKTWGVLLYPMLNALADGQKIVSVPVPYEHPAVQTDTEETPEFAEKRRTQATVIGDGTQMKCLQRGLLDPRVHLSLRVELSGRHPALMKELGLYLDQDTPATSTMFGSAGAGIASPRLTS